MSVFLLILKIIGIALLVILGLIVVIALLALFCPFVYRVKGSYHEKNLQLQVRIWWLGRLLGLCADTAEEGFHTYVRIFGFRKELHLQKEKEDAVKEIGDYGSITKLKTDAETAKKIDELVAKYQELIGTADKDKNKSGLSTSASIEDCVSSAKAAVDALVAGDDNNGQDDASVNPSSTSDFVMVGGDWVTPVATYGQNVNIVLPVVNMGSVNLANISVTPVISNSVTEWPFEIETSGYTQMITDLPGKGNGQSDMDRRRELTWTLKTREDAPSGYYKLQFTALYLSLIHI